MTYRQLIMKIFEGVTDLDKEAKVRLITRDSGSRTALSRKEVPIRYFSDYSNICIEKFDLDAVQEVPY